MDEHWAINRLHLLIPSIQAFPVSPILGWVAKMCEIMLRLCTKIKNSRNMCVTFVEWAFAPHHNLRDIKPRMVMEKFNVTFAANGLSMDIPCRFTKPERINEPLKSVPIAIHWHTIQMKWRYICHSTMHHRTSINVRFAKSHLLGQYDSRCVSDDSINAYSIPAYCLNLYFVFHRITFLQFMRTKGRIGVRTVQSHLKLIRTDLDIWKLYIQGNMI